MGEKRAWLKSGKRTRLRLCAAGLSLSLFLTGCGPLSITPVTVPDIAWPETAGQERGNADVTVTGFGSLSDEVREQTVPLGTALSKLALPDTLEAYVAVDTGDGAEDDEKPDDGDKDKDQDEDKDPDDGDDNGGVTPGEGDDNNGGETPGEGEGGDNGGETPGGGEGGDNGGETPGEDDSNDGGTSDGGDNNNGAGDGEGDGSAESGDGDTPEGGDNNNGGETGGGQTGDGESGADGEESPAGENRTESQGTDGGAAPEDSTDAPEASDSADNKITAGLHVQTGSFVMPSYASENPQDGVKAGTLTDTPAADNGGAAPNRPTGTVNATDGTGDTGSTGTQTGTDTTAAPTDGTGNTAAAAHTAAREERVTLENITWESDPVYDSDTEGIYTFTPVLPEGYALSDGAELPQITVEVICYGDRELTPEELERVLAGLQDNPTLLTEEDIFAEDSSLAAQAGGPRRAAARAAAALHPGTYVTTDDNEDNAGTGNPDGDLDEYLFATDSQHPIEANIFIPEGKLPTKDCYIAVRTWDVDWQSKSDYVEYDRLFVNDVRVGTLTGLQDEWNTSYYRVPLSCLREGNNTVRIEVWDLLHADKFWEDDVEKYLDRDGMWGIMIDWMQLVCDGGSREGIETFSLTLTDAAKEGEKVAVSAETVIGSTDKAAKYDTEYSIADSSGFIVGSYQEAGVTGGIQKFTVTMPADSRDDTYTVQGLLKRTNDGAVLATDSLEFEYKNGEVLFGPKIAHTLSPDTWTNRNVTVTPKVTDASGCTDIGFTPASRTVAANGAYEFTVTYKIPSGTQRTKTYTAAVDNIDKEPPFIGFSAVTVTEGMTQAQFEQLFKESLTVTDNVTKDCKVTYTLPKVADVQAAGGGKVTVTAQDEAGNKATLDCVLIVTSPLALSTPTAARQGTARTFTLTAKLTAIGKKAVTETGFVWGIMPNPSVTYNQGSAKTASPVTKANVNFSVKTTEIVEGMTYYARAYAKVGSLCYYSDPVRFDIGAKQCGVFTIASTGYGRFKVTRTGGTEGAQTVYYRTVNGTAVGGTHFTHQASTLTFKEGETEKVISVSEKGATSAYGGRTATAYSNAARTYEVELYRVTGGGTLGSTTRATRTMSFDLNYEVGRKIYEPLAWRVMDASDLWDNKGSCHKFEITDGGKGETNGKNNGINWYNGRTNHKGHKSDPFNLPRYHHTMYAGTTKEKAYFLDSKNPSDGWAFRYEMKETQIENGWGHLWVGTAPAPTGKQTVSDKNGASPFNGGSQKWTGFFETGYSAGSTIHVPGTPRDHGNEIWASRENGSIYTYGGQKYIMFGADETAYMHFAANGPKDDVWRIDSITDYQILIDTKEPQLLGVAPMANSAYKPGDEVTISLVFDEIVDSQNSQKAGGLNGLVAKTNWGDFTYSYGADTNVLVFKGTVPANASGRINVNSITHADRIKDLCDHAGGTVSAGTGSTNVTVDTKQPTVAITNTSLTNGTASGRVTATNADTLQYAWSQDTAMPAAGWFTCKSGATVTTRQASGKWYLHALATYEGTGASAYACSTVFDFGTPESPKFPLPELAATVNNSSWTNKDRTITITRKPAGATVKVTKPDGTTQTLSNTATTYAAQTNGVYTFVLASNGETVAKDAAVEKIDKVKPTATLTEAGGTDAVYHALTMTAKAADADSGVAKVEYAFTTSATAPASGWTTAADSDKLADGRYKLEYTATETAQATKYLHVKVTDNAGNTFTASSKGYKVVKEPAADQKPAITLTASLSGADWTKDDVTLTWEVTNGGAGGCTVYAGNEMLTGKKKDDTGTFKAQKNGIYMVSLSDKNGDSASATVLVNNIDKEAPTLEKLTVTPAGYANTKTVTLTDATDDLSTQYNEKGVTGKSGSGIKTREYQRDGESGWTAFTGDNFTVSQTGTYRVRLTDNAGNVGREYTINVTSIDTTAPKLTITVNAAPNENSKDKAWYTDSTVPVTLTYEDKAGAEGPASGIKSVQYAFVNPSNPTAAPTTPTSLTSLGSSAVAKGSAVCSLTKNGIWHLYCKVTDKAGNVTEGWRKADGSLTDNADEAVAIKKDSYKGSVIINQAKPQGSKPAADGLTMAPNVYFGPSGASLTAPEAGYSGTLSTERTGSDRVSKVVSWTTKTTGTNYIYLEPNSWGTKYYWTYYVRKVTFDSQGGSEVPDHLVWTTQDSTSTSTTVDCALQEPADPTRTGYEFKGWYTDAACTDGKKFDFANQTQIRTDMTLYAKWKAKTYKVEYHLMVPQALTKNVYNEKPYEADSAYKTYTYGAKMTLPVPTLPTGTRGFVFDGWYTNNSYTGTRYTSIPENATGEINYYGQFKDVEAPIVYPYGDYRDEGDNGWDRKIGYMKWDVYDYGKLAKYELLRDDKIINTETLEENRQGVGIFLRGNVSGLGITSKVVKADCIKEGDHTYQLRGYDTAGNMAETKMRKRFDETAPTAGKITYSTYVTWHTNGSSIIKDTNDSSYHEIKVFSEVPTIRIPVHDNPNPGVNASSGLWKLTYRLTTLNKSDGKTVVSTYDSSTLLTDLGTEGVAEITIPNYTVGGVDYKNWRGKITDIKLYDKAGNVTNIPEIGEMLVDTTPPVIYNNQDYGKICLRSSERAHNERIEDKWYSTDELNKGGYTKILGYTRDTCGLRSYRWLVNGEEKRTYHYPGVEDGVMSPTHEIYVSDAYIYPGVNTFTLEVTDYAGHTTTESVTLKIGSDDPNNLVAERTPAAVCDYPADAIAQLAPNVQYALTVDGTAYSVTTNAQGEIPFVLTLGGSKTDLCGKTIGIVKKGDGVHTDDSASQPLTINPRPAAPNVTERDITPELLADADDAQINLTITDGSYTWEYSTDNGQSYKETPAASGNKSTITNLPKGDILIRAKAKANTSASANDGNPYGKVQTVKISSKAGTITAKFDLNAAGGSAASWTDGGGAQQQAGKHYKEKLTKPANPTRTGYDFTGWYQSVDGYASGAPAWCFDGEDNAQIVGEILGTDRSQYQDNLSAGGVYEVTLYAGWRENVAPKLAAALTNGTDNTAKDQNAWHPNPLAIALTYSDNVGITKLSVKKDNGSYTDMALTGDGITGSGTQASPNKRSYAVEEGTHTYTFQAEDAAGNTTETPVTAKLDSVKPVFGEAKFEEGYKHLWDWIIRRESLTITIPVTIPVTEAGSGIANNGVTYTLTPAAGGTATTGKAAVSGSASAGYKATIKIDKTFKGTVEIKATDNAGNEAVPMQIGASGSGIEGVLVESAAPTVTVKADREPGDGTVTVTEAKNGKEVDAQTYYNSAPRLFVTVKDEDLNLDSGQQTPAGLSSITWKIDDGPENPVGANYLGAGSNAPLTEHRFVIGGLEGKTGPVTVTITAIDQAGNGAESKHVVTLHIKDKMALPAPAIDYINERLTGLTAGTTYVVGGEEKTADADGSIAIDETWFGSGISLHAKTNRADTTLDSDDVQLTFAARPEAPGVTKTNETIKNKKDGKLHNLDDTMEYSADDGKTWTAAQTGSLTDIADGKGVLGGLPAGVFRVRVKARANTAGANDGAPHGQYILAQIEEGTPLTVAFETNGGSDLAPITGLGWNDTVERPGDPAKDGYAVEGWYYKKEGDNIIWHFEGETGAHVLNDTNGVTTTGDTPGITLYAKWQDDESPALDAQLTAGAERAAADERDWYRELAVVLTYSDNEAVTKLYVKKDNETDYTEITGDIGTENGKDEAGNTRYQYVYTGIAEGEHTYTFKAADAAGKVTETRKLTAKLDTVGPVFGTASYEEGHKNLWDWIIRKDSLIITVPVTEESSGVDTVAYALIPANAAAGAAEGDADEGGADIVTGTAKVTGSQSTGYQAKISIAPDFKGSVKITGSDKAGNAADEKTIGTDGNGIKGVIVENNAPQITILADRLPSEPAATREDGTEIQKDALYDKMPGLVVQLTDDGMGYGIKGEGAADGGSVTTSGLASVKYKVGTNPEQTVDKDYKTAIVTQDTFTIPDTETMAPAGATTMTVTVTATDQAGNTATQPVTIRLKSREATPQAGIGYVAEKLTGLRPNTVYIINDMNLETDQTGTVAINESWFDTDVTIVMPGNRETTVNSTAQERNIPARPETPAVGTTNASYPGAQDGVITITAPAQGAAYEISVDGGQTWENAAVSGGQITGLAAGDYQVRVKAVEGKNFSSTPAQIKVEATPATPYDTPAAQIEYKQEVLKGLEAGAVYELTTYGGPIVEDEEGGDGETGGDAGDGGGEDEEAPDPTVLTLTAGADGTIPIREEWLGKGFYIVRKGNNKDKTMSPAQELNIPLRPDAPTPTGVDVDPANPTVLAGLGDLQPNTAYDVSADGGKTWETKTTDANGVITGLDAPETYVARVSATDTNFKGKASGEVAVDSFELTVTFMANGKKHQETKVYYGKELTTVPAVPPKKGAGDQILAGEWCKDQDGNTPVDFSTEKITADLTVYACYSEGRLVTLKTGAGYTLTAQEGSVSPVRLGGSFTFQFTLAAGYEKTDSFAVKVNGVAVELSADGTYTIANITENQTVTVEGVRKTGGSKPKPGGNKPGDGGDNGGDNGGGDNGDDNGGDNGGTNPGDGTKPGDGKKPGDGTKPGDDKNPGDGTKPGGGKKPGDGMKPGDDKNPGDGTQPGGDKKPGDGRNPGGGTNPPVGDDVPRIPVTIEDGKIVIDDGIGTGAGGSGTDGTGTGTGTDGSGTDGSGTGAGGGIATGNVPGMAGAGTAPQDSQSTVSTMLRLGDGAVIVTVVCNGGYTAGVTDTVAVANAALTPAQMQLAADGGTIEIRVEVTDISESVPQQDKEAVESAIGEYQSEIPGLTLGMYIDISVFIRVGEGDWNAIRKTGEPIDVVIGIPEGLRDKGSVFYIIRAHDGGCDLLHDTDGAEDTITISTDLFSSYAIAYIESDGTHTGANCELCHICPTFLGICYFIWLAVIIAVIVIVILLVLRRKKEEER